jgi:hypothetical protein
LVTLLAWSDKRQYNLRDSACKTEKFADADVFRRARALLAIGIRRVSTDSDRTPYEAAGTLPQYLEPNTLPTVKF